MLVGTRDPKGVHVGSPNAAVEAANIVFDISALRMLDIDKSQAREEIQVIKLRVISMGALSGIPFWSLAWLMGNLR